jgi:diaminopimelate decarboxylase
MSTLSGELLMHAAEQFGTPVYIYHAETIREQFNRLQSAFTGINTRFFYASKALTNINILKYIRTIGCNIDCSSSNEVLLALHAGFKPENILYTSNNVSIEELKEVAGKKVSINIDSISNLRKFGRIFGSSYPVGIRLRPNILAGGNLKISTGHSGSKFGIPLEQIDQVHEVVNESGIMIRVLHLHTGSDIKDVDVFIRGVQLLFTLTAQFPHLDSLDLGGGFKVPYQPGDHETDIVQLGIHLKESLDDFEKTSGKKFQIWFEPGKFLVSASGYLAATVNVIKEGPGETFIGLNTGLNHLIRPMFYDAYHTIANLSNPNGQPKKYTVTGNICETDTFATDRLISEVREGDLLVFKNAGAYGFEMSSNYNARYKPAEVLVSNGRAELIRRPDGFEDLLRNQIGLT